TAFDPERTFAPKKRCQCPSMAGRLDRLGRRRQSASLGCRVREDMTRHSLLLASIALVACLDSIPQAKSGRRVDQRASRAYAALVGTGLPAVTQGDRTEQRSLTEWMEALAVPGVSIAVIDDNRIVWAKAYGVTTPGPLGSPVTP